MAEHKFHNWPARNGNRGSAHIVGGLAWSSVVPIYRALRKTGASPLLARLTIAHFAISCRIDIWRSFEPPRWEKGES